jgi:hypothetical protein
MLYRNKGCLTGSSQDQVSRHFLHIMIFLLMLSQCVKAVESLLTYITYQRIKIGFVIVNTRFSLHIETCEYILFKAMTGVRSKNSIMVEFLNSSKVIRLSFRFEGTSNVSSYVGFAQSVLRRDEL